MTEQRTLITSGTTSLTLAWESFGDDTAPPLLLVAGLGTQMIRWTAPFCTALAAHGYRVVRFDNRDAGCSEAFTRHGPVDIAALVAQLMAGRRPDLAYTLADMARDALGLLDALGIARAHVVGRSMGGMIAQIMASEHPARVASLCSIMSGTGNPTLPQAAPDVMAMMTTPAPDPHVDEAGFVAHNLAFARRIAGTGFPFDEAAARALILAELHRGHVPGGLGRQLAAIATTGDRRARLAGIAVPSLVIHGTDDPLIPPTSGEDTAAAIPHATWLPIPGMGHDLPEGCHATIIDAIDRNARSAA